MISFICIGVIIFSLGLADSACNIGQISNCFSFILTIHVLSMGINHVGNDLVHWKLDSSIELCKRGNTKCSLLSYP